MKKSYWDSMFNYVLHFLNVFLTVRKRSSRLLFEEKAKKTMIYILDAILESKPRVQPSIQRLYWRNIIMPIISLPTSFLRMQKKQHVTRQQVI